MAEGDLEAQLLALGRRIGAHDAMGWLQGRWNYLNEVSPQQVTVDAGHLRSTGKRRLEWVPSDLVSYVDEGGWGEANRLPGTYRWFINALVAADAHSIKDWIHDVGHPPLVELAGPYGPLYQAGDDGHHRTAILKALGTHWQYEVLPQRGLDIGEQFLVVVHPLVPDHPLEERRRHQQRVRDRLAHLDLLVRAGLVEPVGRTLALESRGFIVTSSLPFPWALQQPAAVEAASHRYKQSYRHFGATDAERASLNAGGWSQYLTALAAHRTGPQADPDATRTTRKPFSLGSRSPGSVAGTV